MICVFWLLGECENISINKSTYSESNLADSVTIDMKFKNGCTTNIFVSYVTPFINRSNMIFENAIVEQEDGIINLYENWNTIDEKGFFKTDDEIGFFFKTVMTLQELLNEFKIKEI